MIDEYQFAIGILALSEKYYRGLFSYDKLEEDIRRLYIEERNQRIFRQTGIREGTYDSMLRVGISQLCTNGVLRRWSDIHGNEFERVLDPKKIFERERKALTPKQIKSLESLARKIDLL